MCIIYETEKHFKQKLWKFEKKKPNKKKLSNLQPNIHDLSHHQTHLSH